MYKTKPYDHQRDAVEESCDLKAYAYLMEMGTGKSKVLIDVCSYLHQKGEIDTLIILCPNGLQQNWILRELPVHMAANHAAMFWVNGVKNNRKWQRLKEVKGKLKVFALNLDKVLVGPRFKDLVEILKSTNCMLAIDESQRIKNHKSLRTQAMMKLAPIAKYRRILSGTPVTNSPMDLFSQFKFLSPRIFGIKYFNEFKHRYADVVKIKINDGVNCKKLVAGEFCIECKKYKKTQLCVKNRFGYYEKIVAIKNIAELKQKISAYSFIVKKKDCLDLPEKVYENYYVELTPDQKRIYKEMVDTAIATIEGIPEGLTEKEKIMWILMNDKIIGTHALTRLLRCQQVLGGYVKDEHDNIVEIKSNRIKETINLIKDLPNDTKMIIWARFKPELAAVVIALKNEFGARSVVEYHGGTGDTERVEAVDKFQNDPETLFFVSNPAAGGIGLTLTAAWYVLWFSMNYSLEHYLQGNDRAHRIGQKKKVTYIHLISPNTLDGRILKALENKAKIAEEII